jgi:3',5'-cyclic AMP phosphodiesterase CpdA
VFTGGDIIMDAWEADYARTDLQWKLFRNVMAAECSLPVEHCLGNHDVWSFKSREGNKDHEAKSVKKWALDVLGLTSPYRSFDRAGWHFIVLDSVYPKDPQYIGKLDEEQFEWLTEDLGKTPETMPVLVVSHIPILSICAHFFQEMTQDDNWVVPGGLMHIDARRIRDLFKSYKNVKAAIAGHIHLVDRLDYLGVTYLGNGAVSGAWWSGDWHETPAGYALMDLFDDGTVERTYMPYGWQVKAT